MDGEAFGGNRLYWWISPTIWSELKNTYVRELPGIAFSAIPKETVVAYSFMDIVEIFKHNYF